MIHSDNQPEAIMNQSSQIKTWKLVTTAVSIEGKCISANMLDLL